MYRMIEEHKSLEVSEKDSGSNTLTFFSFLPQFPLCRQSKCFSLSHTCVLGKILSEIPAVNRAACWGGFEGVISIHSLFAVRPSDSLKHAQHTHFLHLTLTTGHTHKSLHSYSVHILMFTILSHTHTHRERGSEHKPSDRSTKPSSL